MLLETLNLIYYFKKGLYVLTYRKLLYNIILALFYDFNLLTYLLYHYLVKI